MAALPEHVPPTLAAIWQAYESAQDSGYRDHLGYSGIGNECERAIWYSFRWTTRARFTGRMLRLFATGHLSEARFIEDLRRIGVTVMDVDPDTGRQWRVVGSTGHDGGSMDAVGFGFPEAPKTWHLVEFKTHSAKSFKELQRKAVREAKPMHWAQMQAYMHLSGLERAAYLAVNKDTDELYFERVYHDPTEAERLIAKAARIVNAVQAPARMSLDPELYLCRWCDHKDTCWQDARPERHCRSCAHSTPVQGGTWHCALRDETRDSKAQRAGCGSHAYLPDFIRGEPIDADPVKGTITYRLADGSEWKDGAE